MHNSNMFKNAPSPRPALLNAVRTHIRRRLLLNYRVDPGVAASLLPDGFRPLLVDGSAVAGICMIGLESIRPAWITPRCGVSSENATHRMAVEWDDGGVTHTGVFIFERCSSAAFPAVFGGRLFPGVHRRASFTTAEEGDRFAASMDDVIDAEVVVTDAWHSSLFPRLEDASRFYRDGRIGWSLRHDGVSVEALAFDAERWTAEAAEVSHVRSSFFDALPAGSATFDHALVMRDLDVVMSRL